MLGDLPLITYPNTYKLVDSVPSPIITSPELRFKTDDVLKVYEEYAQQLSELVKKGFAAAVYTQTTDVEGEVNGLMTYDRKVVKLDMDRLSSINRRVIESM